MYELIQVSESCYYVQSPAKIGVVRIGGSDVVLIDSGNDKDAGKKVRKLLEQQGWTLRAIYNTHSHADHIGGNRLLQSQTGCAVYAPDIELAFTVHPILESTFLYGGSPPTELRHKFLMAQESDAQLLTEDILPEDWELLPLPGHSFNMMGFRTPDDVVFLADCLSSRETLEKYRFSYLVDVEAYLATLDMVRGLDAALFVPSHAEPTTEIANLTQINIDSVHENAELLLRLCETPACFDEILRGVFTSCGLTMSFEQHALVGSTVRSYLSWLHRQERLQAVIRDNTLFWLRTV